MFMTHVVHNWFVSNRLHPLQHHFAVTIFEHLIEEDAWLFLF